MTRGRVAWFGVWAISLVAAFHLGGRERSDESPARPQTVSARPSLPDLAPRCTIDENAMRRAVADAVSAKLESATPATNEIASERDVATDTQEPDFDPEIAARAYKRGSELLDVALARGAWTRQDAGDLRLVILQLPREQRHSLLDRLFGAVNANQLRNEAPGAPI